MQTFVTGFYALCAGGLLSAASGVSSNASAPLGWLALACGLYGTGMVIVGLGRMFSGRA